MFFGWKVVAALFVILMFSSGLGFYNNAIILQALSRDGGFPIELASSAVSLFFISSGVTGLLIAPILERTDVRIVIVVGAVIAGLSLMLIGNVTTVTGLFLLYTVFGAGFCASGLLPATTLVARWFESSRAKALSIASTGLSVGGITLTPISAYLLENYSLVDASVWIGGLYMLGIIPVAMVLRSYPEDIGLAPDGATGGPSRAPPGILLADAVRQNFFWLFGVSYIFGMAAQVGGIAHQYGLLLERVSAAEASIGIAILPLFSVIGRLLGGWVLDSVSTRRFALVMMVCQGISLMILAQSTSVWGIYFSFAFFGITVGNLLMLQPLIIAEVYGLRQYARIYAWSNMLTMVGVGGGPALMGVMYANAGGYGEAYMAAGAMGFTSAILYFVARVPSRHSEETA